MCVHICMESQGCNQESPLTALPPYSLEQGLPIKLKASQYASLTGQLAPWIPLQAPCHSISVGSRDLEYGPLVCTVGALTTEQSLLPLYV